MSKGSNVYYKLPFEDLRGKLAIKQKDIKYTGQRDTEAAFDLPMGKHQAVNYDSCIVLSKRRGSNRFYVKKNTTISITRRGQLNKAILGLCASLTARMAASILASLEAGSDDYEELYESYEFYAKEGQTLREWLATKVIEAVQTQDVLFEYDKLPNPDTGEIEPVAYAPNPLRSASFDLVVDGSTLTMGFTELWSEKQVYQKFYRTMATLWQPASTHTIHIVRKDLSTYDLTILFQTGADEVKTVKDFIDSIQGDAFWGYLGKDQQQQPIYGAVIYRSDGRLWATGQLYTDEARTTLLDPTTALNTIDTVYIK